MDEDRTVYSISTADIQTVARAELGRELSAIEIARIEDPLAERIDWFAAIAETIFEQIQ